MSTHTHPILDAQSVESSIRWSSRLGRRQLTVRAAHQHAAGEHAEQRQKENAKDNGGPDALCARREQVLRKVIGVKEWLRKAAAAGWLKKKKIMS